MGRESLITHRPGSHFLKINQDFLEMLSWDHCCAALLAIFEYWSNGKIAQVDLSPEEIWLDCSMADLSFQMLRLYSQRAIQDALQRLEAAGYLLVRRAHGGELNQYRVNFDAVNRAITPGWTPPDQPEPNGKTAVSNPELTAKLPLGGCNFAVTTSVKELNTEATYLPTENSPNQSLSQDFLEFSTFLRMWKTHRGFKKPAKHQLNLAQERWADVSIDEDTLRDALDGYYDSNLATDGWPILPFIANPHGWALGKRRRDEEALEVSDILPAPPVAPSASEAPSQISALQESDPVAKYHEIVTSGPAAILSNRDRREIAGIFRDDAIDPEKYSSILSRVQKIYSKLHTDHQDPSGWFTLLWTMRNWSKVLSGGCDFLMRPERSSVMKFDNPSDLADRALANYAKRGAA